MSESAAKGKTDSDAILTTTFVLAAMFSTGPAIVVGGILDRHGYSFGEIMGSMLFITAALFIVAYSLVRSWVRRVF